MHWWSKIVGWIAARLGGPQRARILLLLGAALGLQGADLGTLGAMAAILQKHFSITKVQIGYLVAATQGVGIFSALFYGSLVDKTRRTRLLAIAIVLWAAAIVACGAATSYEFLIIARVALGLFAAAALPCTASLIGDYFPGRQWGKAYGDVLAGEMLGTGFGFVVSGEAASVWWRLGFWVLLLPAIPLAWGIYKLPEPERGGSSERAKSQQNEERLIAKTAREHGVEPRRRLIRDEDPGGQSIWWAVKYVLSVPTNVVLIICSALGYAFFAAVRTFGIEFAEARYGVKHEFAVSLLLVMGVGALLGIWTGGRLGDRLLQRGHTPARVWVATAFLWGCVGLFFLGFLFDVLWLSIVFFIGASFSLGAVNPPLDSARLDIMHPKLWGRAESVRMMLRYASEAVTPIGFGWLASHLGQDGAGLRNAFLISVIPLAIAAAIGFITFRTYPPDAAAAAEYRRRTCEETRAQIN